MAAECARRLAATRSLAAIVALLGVSRPCLADPPVDSPVRLGAQYSEKAEFLFSFGRYIEWPESSFAGPASKFVVGVVGDDSFADAIERMASKKTMQDRQVTVRRFETVADYRPPCHILFSSRSLNGEQQRRLIQMAAGEAALLVGESAGFAERGGTINFYVERGRLRFEINAAAARRAQLHFDAKLLNLGKPVGHSRQAAVDQTPLGPSVERVQSPPASALSPIQHRGN